jgi:TRAP-type C4-dicarboxylate transport system permease small subunit
MRTKLDRFLEIILVGLIAIILINVVWQVITRYLFNSPSTITEEISRFGLVWFGFLGVVYANSKGLHLAINVLIESTQNKTKIFFSILINLLILIFSFSVLIVGGLNLIIINYQLGQLTAGLGIQMGHIYLVIPISGLFISFHCFENLIALKVK